MSGRRTAGAPGRAERRASNAYRARSAAARQSGAGGVGPAPNAVSRAASPSTVLWYSGSSGRPCGAPRCARAAAVGGWKDIDTLLKCYSRADRVTMLGVMSEPKKLRTADVGRRAGAVDREVLRRVAANAAEKLVAARTAT